MNKARLFILLVLLQSQVKDRSFFIEKVLSDRFCGEM